MTSYIFQQIAKRGKAEGIDSSTRQRDARTWFRQTAANVKGVNRARMLNDPDKDNIVDKIDVNSIGRMYAFFYDPKFKQVLPFYDMFPLVFVIGPKGSNGFLGMNLHYLPPVLRAKLMNNLYDTINNKKFDNTTKLNINYQMLTSAAKFRYFEPCVKHYLFDHVQSKFLQIEPKFWDAALMLPTEKFRKADIDTVWNKSRSRVA